MSARADPPGHGHQTPRRSPHPAPYPATGGGRDRAGGYVLMEMMMALIVIALLAALALPLVRPGGGAGAVRVKAMEVAALMRLARNEALRTGRPVSVVVDGDSGVVSHGQRAVRVDPPIRVALRGQRVEVTFHQDGHASADDLLLASQRAAYVVRVNGQTAAVDVMRSGR